jgi:hypothetical protein
MGGYGYRVRARNDFRVRVRGIWLVVFISIVS